jgi:hypothetical protein
MVSFRFLLERFYIFVSGFGGENETQLDSRLEQHLVQKRSSDGRYRDEVESFRNSVPI